MNFQNELLPLHRFISDNLLGKTISQKITVAQFKNCDTFIDTEYKRIRDSIEKTAFGFLKPAHQVLYIHKHQAAINKLMNIIHHYLVPKVSTSSKERDVDSNLQSLYKKVNGRLDDLLLFIQVEFPDCFNWNEKVPYYYLLPLREDFRYRMKTIKRQLVKNNTNENLIHLIFCPISEFCNNHNVRITYRKMQYMDHLLTELKHFNKKRSYSHYPPVIELLIEMEFNCTRFIKYLTDYIADEVRSITTEKEKVERLLLHFKEFNQLHSVHGSLYPTSPPVKESISAWLRPELIYITEKYDTGDKSKKKGLSAVDPDWGMHYLLTADELGLFKKVKKEAGFLNIRNVTKMSEFMSENYSSKGRENTAAETYYNGYHTTNLAVYRSLHDKIMVMEKTLYKMELQVKKKKSQKN